MASASGAIPAALALTVQEGELVREMVQRVERNAAELYHNRPITAAIAQKFLTARKFNLLRAEALYASFLETYIKHDLLDVDPNQPGVLAELRSGKFVVPGSRDSEDAEIVIFNAAEHTPDKQTLNATLKSIVYILSCITDDGVTFIYNMTNAGWANMDSSMTRALLDVLQNAFPGRLTHAWILNAPFWMKATVRFIFPLIGAKLSNRVQFVTSMDGIVSRNALPETLGGQLPYNDAIHQQHVAKWLGKHTGTHMLITPGMAAAKASAAAAPAAAAPAIPAHKPVDRQKPPQKPALPDQRQSAPQERGQSQETHEDEDEDEDEGEGPPPPVPPRPTRSVPVTSFSADEWAEKVHSLRQEGGIMRHFFFLQNAPVTNTFEAASHPTNLPRNRYTNVLAYDQTRVRLPESEDEESDYINANYVDGYEHKRAYIACQGPLPNTFEHFWAMLWHEGASIIVMATREIESGRMKCHQYWPSDGEMAEFGKFRVTSTKEEMEEGYIVRQFEVENTEADEMRTVDHYQFIGWPDHGIPDTSYPVLEMLDKVNSKRTEKPVIVHCSAGIGRTGTFITVDICVKQLRKEKRADVFETVKSIREQRFGSVQTPQQYDFCYNAVQEALESVV